MRDSSELLDNDDGGLRFAGSRALLFDAVALGWLRAELIDKVGVTTARGILTRLGYAHGVRMAEAAQHNVAWEDLSQYRRAGTRFAEQMGFAHIEAAAEEGHPAAIWRASYEAEQHLLHLGRSEDPVCWTLCGFASGWLSFASGTDTFFLEDRCVGRGDAVCHVVGKPADDWEAERAHEIEFFQKENLNESVARLGSRLKQVEKTLRRQRRALAAVDAEPDEDGLIARSPATRRVLSLAHRVAGVDTTVLLTGESGTGKERVARVIHDHSARAHRPFVAVNCGALSDALLESELFGHKRGAFTGAQTDRIGLFEAAHRGTLFLDEIGEVSPAMQVKLLRALQEREIRRVGENESRKIDVRILAATNRDLAGEIEAGRFREDLYYRLRVVEIDLPPLRKRTEDIIPLAHLFRSESARRMGREAGGIEASAADALVRYRWPGNVRELSNAMERTVALGASSQLRLDDLPAEIREVSEVPVASRRAQVRPLRDIEREYVLEVLARNGGNQSRTARQLGIGTATLYRKLKRWGEK